jgi:hypothetical protein
MRNLIAASFAIALSATPLVAPAQTAAPAMAGMPAMDASSIDCSTASAHIMSMMKPPAGAMDDMKPGASTDATYADAMKMMLGHAAMMAKIEMKCGKDAKAMAMAKKMLEQEEDDYLSIQAIPTQI